MKKLLLCSSIVLSAIAANAQGNVSTTPSNRVAILEEYTGNFCTYCPDGHLIADQIEATGAVTLKLQVGSFSGTDPIFGGSLQTPTTDVIAGPFDSQGYPNGTVNRAPGNLGIGRGAWTSAAAAIQSQVSPVNLYLESAVDVTTGQLVVSVEYFYTSSPANSTNYLHIGYYQDNIPAYQYDPGFNPNQFYILSEGLYEFDHCFRDMVNGNWGEIITATGAGATSVINYSITLPAGFNGFDIENGAIKVFAFMSETPQGEIITAGSTTPTYNNFPNSDELGIIYSTSFSDVGCVGSSGSVSPTILVANYGGNDLTSFATDHGVNGGSEVGSWNGSITHNENVPVTLANHNYTIMANNTLNVEASLPNTMTDPSIADNTFSAAANITDNVTDISVTVEIHTDGYGDEVWMEITNSAGTIVWSEGNETVQGNFDTGTFPAPADPTNPLGNDTDYSWTAWLPGIDCYTFTIYDYYGDGLSDPAATNGYYRVKDNTGNIIITQSAANFGGSEGGAFKNNSLGINELAVENVSIYPNPVSDILNVAFTANNSDYTVSVMDLQGRVVASQVVGGTGSQTVAFSVADIAAGSYIVTIASEVESHTDKVVIK